MPANRKRQRNWKVEDPYAKKRSGETWTKWGREAPRPSSSRIVEHRNVVREDDGKAIYRRPLIIPQEDDICDMMGRLVLEKKVAAPSRATPADIALKAVLDSLI